MAANVITGDAVIHGIPSNGSAITLTGYASFLMDKVKAAHMFESYYTKDNQGNDAGATAFNEHAEVDVDFTITGSTRANAANNAGFPGPLSVMSLANLQCIGSFFSTSSGILSANMLYVGGASLDLSQLIAGKITGLKMRVYANSAQNTLMTTLVVG